MDGNTIKYIIKLRAKILYGLDLVNQLRKHADNIKERLWIAVPYIGEFDSVQRIIGRTWLENYSLSVRLLTDICEFNNFNTETIKAFYKIGKIKHLLGLHAKIFIFDNYCLITSANLTNTAFSKRYEIGIFLDEDNSERTISVFENWWKKSDDVTLDNLRIFSNKKFNSTEESIGSKFPTIWNLPEAPQEINYWLKPVGATESPITEERLFNKIIEDLHFSKIEPKGVKIGDILIAYGIGAGRILSVYKVISLPMKVSSEDIEEEEWMKRWPWYVTAKNLTKKFGEEWSQHNLYANKMCENYLNANPNGFITKVKGKTLGALNYHADKIKLDHDFAKYIIKKIIEINYK